MPRLGGPVAGECRQWWPFREMFEVGSSSDSRSWRPGQAPSRPASRMSGALEDRFDLGNEPSHGFLVIWRGEPGDEVPVADLEIGGELLGHVLRRPDRLVLPGPGFAVPFKERQKDALRLSPRVADDYDAQAGCALDLALDAPDVEAVLLEHRLLE